MLFEEFQIDCLVHGTLISAWDDFSNSESPYCLMYPINFQLMSTYGLEDDVWRISRWPLRALPSMMWMKNLSLSKWTFRLTSSTKFLLKRIYDLEDVVWGISNWLFSAWQSLIHEWNELFQVFLLNDAFHQVSAQEGKWFGRRCGLKKFKSAVWCMAIFGIWMEWFELSGVFMLPDASQVSTQESIWLGKRCCLKNIIMAV